MRDRVKDALFIAGFIAGIVLISILIAVVIAFSIWLIVYMMFLDDVILIIAPIFLGMALAGLGVFAYSLLVDESNGDNHG